MHEKKLNLFWLRARRCESAEAACAGLADAQSLKQAAAEKRPLPKVLYTVPIGQNPASFCIPAQRRQEIYDVCSRHDLLIVEDDPYWAIQFPAHSGGSRSSTGRFGGEIAASEAHRDGCSHDLEPCCCQVPTGCMCTCAFPACGLAFFQALGVADNACVARWMALHECPARVSGPRWMQACCPRMLRTCQTLQ